jgi:predicted helicase
VSLLRKSQQKQTPKPLRPQNNLDDDTDFIIDDEVKFGRNIQSRNFGKIVHEDVNLSDYVTVRLAVARAKAMEAYRKRWQT